MYKIGFVPVDKFAEAKLFTTLQSDRITRLEAEVARLQDVAKTNAARWRDIDSRLYHVENQFQFDDNK